MPVKQCSEKGKPGFKWGDKGKCYTYTSGNKASMLRARKKALTQGRATHANTEAVNNILDNLIKKINIQIEKENAHVVE